MYVALDKLGNRIYADDEQRYTECFCPACGEQLLHKKGTRKRAHFAHKQKSDCLWGLNKDHMSEWHIRMQSYFPKESREYRFQDMQNGEVHIADIFDKNTNTIIEFQHSPIYEEEYLSRTDFHLNNGRRIVWIFDESRENAREGYIGRLKYDDLYVPNWKIKGIPLNRLYEDRTFKWLYSPRKFLSAGPDIKDYNDKYSVFVYTGEKEDVVHRVISQEYDFEFITLSVGETIMNENMSTSLFFESEKTLLLQEPWNTMIEDRAKEIKKNKAKTEELRNEIRTKDRTNKGLNTDLTKCPLCGGELKLRTSKKGKSLGNKFYGCSNYPKCNFTENYYDSIELQLL